MDKVDENMDFSPSQRTMGARSPAKARGAPAPPGLPFRWDAEMVRNGLNFTLTTSVGDLDILGEVAGGGTYEQLLPYTEEVGMFGVKLRVVSLEKLIQLKRAAGRHKDLEAIAELQALLEEKQRTGN